MNKILILADDLFGGYDVVSVNCDSRRLNAIEYGVKLSCSPQKAK